MVRSVRRGEFCGYRRREGSRDGQIAERGDLSRSYCAYRRKSHPGRGEAIDQSYCRADSSGCASGKRRIDASHGRCASRPCQSCARGGGIVLERIFESPASMRRRDLRAAFSGHLAKRRSPLVFDGGLRQQGESERFQKSQSPSAVAAQPIITFRSHDETTFFDFSNASRSCNTELVWNCRASNRKTALTVSTNWRSPFALHDRRRGKTPRSRSARGISFATMNYFHRKESL